MNDLAITDYLQGDRYKHTEGVTIKSLDIAKPYALPLFNTYLVLRSAELHDIGYSDKIPKPTGFHPLDGYLFLKGKVDIRIASTVLLHTHAASLVRYEHSEVYTLFNKELNELKDLPKAVDYDLINIVSIADMLTDTRGVKVTMLERYQDVVERYGAKAHRTIVMKESLSFYESLVALINDGVN